jgi:cytochrome c oxidase subunit 2
VADLFWLLVVAGAVIWLVVVGALVYATAQRRRVHSEDAARRLILWGGAIVPSLLLAILLACTFWLMPQIRPWAKHDAPAALRIEVVGEQFWWRVRYLDEAGGLAFETANEIRIPTGQPVALALSSADVLHSFWVPSLAGKLDLVPGKNNRLRLAATRAGTWRGQCAEYCGGPHAQMALYLVAHHEQDFEIWREAQRRPAHAPDDKLLLQGNRTFLAYCAACHTVRGTPAEGRLGPDLTHVGSRVSIGAGILPNNTGALAAWIASSQHIKPGNLMPSFREFSGDEIRALAAYVESLK